MRNYYVTQNVLLCLVLVMNLHIPSQASASKPNNDESLSILQELEVLHKTNSTHILSLH